jgi:hypothetical protein
MASLPKIEFHDQGFRELLTGPEIKRDLKRRADAIALAAGPGDWNVSEWTGPKRANVSIGANDWLARRNQARNGALIHAIDAGRI